MSLSKLHFAQLLLLVLVVVEGKTFAEGRCTSILYIIYDTSSTSRCSGITRRYCCILTEYISWHEYGGQQLRSSTRHADDVHTNHRCVDEGSVDSVVLSLHALRGTRPSTCMYATQFN